MKLSTIAHIDGFYYRPRIDFKTLKQYSQGLICLSGCPKGELQTAILENNLDKARQIIQEYLDIFGPDYYLEMQSLTWQDEIQQKNQEHILSLLNQLSREMNVEYVATHDVHYLSPEHAAIQDIMVCIQTGKTVDEKKRLDMRDVDLSFLSADEIAENFKQYPKALENSLKIADKCELELDLKTWHYPAFATPNSKTDEEYLKELVQAGAEKKFTEIKPEIQERIDYELDIINFKKYASYFLIVADFMTWARNHGILTTSRGSVSGSLVAYCLGITNVDPLFYQLPFERFLTKERISPPDMDLDISDIHRDEVIDYVKEKYGETRVAQICTFGTMMARGSFRDVSRSLGKSASWADKYAKMIPFGSQGFHMSLEKALTINPELKNIYDSDLEVRRVYDISQKIEGCARHVSVHAAGVIITPTTLTDYVPLQVEPKGRKIITQYDMYALDPNVSKESIGLLKMDFLGLRNLSILGLCVDLVAKIKHKSRTLQRGASLPIDVNNLPLNDKKTFDMLSSGLTFGVFQLASSGMTRYLKELKPTKIPDLMAMVALYRPGPMEIIPEFIKRKNDPSAITYPDPRLKDILKLSYGLLIYQDDILLTAVHLAGYEPGEADAFRKAVGKKIPSQMAAQRVKFIKGCTDNGLTNKKAEEIWNLIEPFAGYGFNKAHAASYGMLAYQTAYMKANYPAEYMSALMTCEAGNSDKIAEAVRACKNLNIRVLPPDVNESLGDFTYISDSEIRFGLSAIKNLGSDIIQTVISERKTNGRFKTLEDFLKRIKTKNLNKKSLEALICTGALDSLGSRAQMYYNINKLLHYIRYIKNRVDNGQASLFSAITKEDQVRLNLDIAPEIDPMKILSWEKELLGLYVSDHPFNKFVSNLPDSVKPISCTASLAPEQRFIIAGLINKIRKILTKKNELMMFVEIEDLSARSEIIVFPSIFQQNPNLWQENSAVILRGRISDKNNEKKIIAEKAAELNIQNIKNLSSLIQSLQVNQSINQALISNGIEQKNIIINIPSLSNSEIIRKLKVLLEQNSGQYPVHLELARNGAKKILTKFKIKFDIAIKKKIEEITGINSVKIR